MNTSKPIIDPYLFEQQLSAFKKFIEEESKVSFESFSSNPYLDDQVKLKIKIYGEGRKKLNFQDWNSSEIGSGKIIASTIESINVGDYLVAWSSRNAINDILSSFDTIEQDHKKAIEQCVFNLFHKNEDETTFDELIRLFGQKYPVVAYLFFLKDRSKYLPISTTSFDKSFNLLGATFSTFKRCSWENYTQYLDLISQLQIMLSEILPSKVEWIEAHTFAWTLGYDMKEENLADVKEYLSLTDTEREAIVNARIGQGLFREHLINYWKSCAVTGCQEHALLIASHIKPWAKSDNTHERLDLYNGLLLSPNLDACFDSGFISFDDSGRILVSTKLKEKDMRLLGINKDMKLSRIDPKHHKYLAYHRENIFRS